MPSGVKSEARNPKFETISNNQIPNARNKQEFKKIEFREFGFVSGFDIRISDFLATYLIPAAPGWKSIGVLTRKERMSCLIILLSTSPLS